MNEVSREQNEPLANRQSSELSSPHFDETAVAEAQPVERLPRSRFSLSRLSLQPIAIIAAFGLVLIMVAVAAGFLMDRSQRAAMGESAAPQKPSPTAESAQTETSPVQVIEPATAAVTAAARDARSVRPRRMRTRLRAPNRIAPVFTEEAEAGGPVTRKVDEIRYRRASDRP